MAIAVRNDIDLRQIRAWCIREGALARFEKFAAEVERTRQRRALRAARRKSEPGR